MGDSDITVLASRIQQGERRALAQGITLVESTRPDHRRLSAQLLDLLLPSSPRNTVRLGISGPPGVGKSTFIEAAGSEPVEPGPPVWRCWPWTPPRRRTGGSISGRQDPHARPGRRRHRHSSGPRQPAAALGGVTETTASAVALVGGGRVRHRSSSRPWESARAKRR